MKMHIYLYNFFIIPIFLTVVLNWVIQPVIKVLNSLEIKFLIFTHFSFYQLLNFDV